MIRPVKTTSSAKSFCRGQRPSRWGMLSVFAAIFFAGITATAYTPRIYRSQATLLVTRIAPVGSSEHTAQGASGCAAEYRELVGSDAVLAEAMARLEAAQAGVNDPQLGHEWLQHFIASHAGEIAQLRSRVHADLAGDGALTIRVDWPQQRRVARELGIDSRELAADRAAKLAGLICESFQKHVAQLDEAQFAAAQKLCRDRALKAARQSCEQTDRQLHGCLTNIGKEQMNLERMLQTSLAACPARILAQLETLNTSAAAAHLGLLAQEDRVNRLLQDHALAWPITSVAIICSASRPNVDQPHRPVVWLNVLASMGAGIFGALGLGLLKRWWSCAMPRVKSSSRNETDSRLSDR